MCGRYQFTKIKGIEDYLKLDTLDIESAKLSDDIRPTNMAPVVANDHPHTLTTMRWGLLPSWLKLEADGKIPRWAQSTFNAVSEEAEKKPAFRSAYKSKRCLVPTQGYFEWTGEKGAKQKWLFTLKESEFMILAGLWDTWQSPTGEVRSFTILTTAANDMLKPYHHRMPVILPHDALDIWLGGTTAQIASLLLAYPGNEIRIEKAA